MKYTRQAFSIQIIGHRYGEQWNGCDGYVKVEKTLRDGEKLSSVVNDILSRDFVSAFLSSDTFIKVTLIKPNRRSVRYFDITLFSSIADRVGVEYFNGD